MKHGWLHIRNILESKLNPGLFTVWIKPLEAELTPGALTLYAPNEFVASWVRDRLMNTITEAATTALGVTPAIMVKARQAPGSALADEAKAPATLMARPARAAATQHPGSGAAKSAPSQNWRFSFDDFVVGPCNQLAHAASRSVCTRTAGADKLFLCSGPGLGKTHLLQAIGRHLSCLANTKSPRIRYLTAEQFATSMIVALKTREIERFKAEFRENVDLLLLEDIHFLQNKEKIQDELLATLNALQSRGCKVVFTSSFLPRELSGVDKQLVSRFCSGFLAVIDRPDFETRRRIVEHKAERAFQVSIPDDVSSLLAERIDGDIRLLESCLQNMVLKAQLLNQRITLELACQIVDNYAAEPSSPDMERIIKAVCSTFKLKDKDLRSKSRKQAIVMARNTAFFLARKHTDLSLADIGQQFNRRHSTVLKGITRVEREMSKQTPNGRQFRRAMELLEM